MYIFTTPFLKDTERNGQVCEVMDTECNKKANYDFIKVRFADGYETLCFKNKLFKLKD